MSIESQKAIEYVWGELSKQIQGNRDAINLVAQRTEKTMTAIGVGRSTFVALPTLNNSSGDMLFCTNCRKIGEGGGAGTGQIVYWNPNTTTWKRISDDVDAAI